ncbi:lysozyme [Ancylobacter sp. 6x-1]|uniref:Lysozyme n=1 Tax=Ancylobacter crimeensis TaxID=2579147 RepID=A0ABT0D8Q5_9HYPH|nr:lysozyme [Ancylobacter crimeensis]MCK0196335.1 lysozyme [Ancylobacter crimeensis]
MSRHINEEGLLLIKQWEGCRLKAYRDPVGIWTVGYGHTDAAGPPRVGAGLSLSTAEAEALLRRDLAPVEAAVEAAVKVPLTDNQFAALVSFTFNLGAANLRRSTLLAKLNAGDYAAVPKELAKWNRAGGRVIAGLSNRRAAEAGLWARDAFVASNYVAPTPVARLAGLDGNGAAATAIGLAGTGAAEMAQQLLPFVGVSRLLQYAFVALTMVGAAAGLVGAFRKARTDAGLA